MFNNNRNRSEYVGLKYTEGEQHGQNTNSTILDNLQSWYLNSELNATAFSQYIETNIGFCSDRNVASGDSWSSTENTHYYASYRRIRDGSPSLGCSNNDIIKVQVGLITADEVMFAGISYSEKTTNNYLYTGQAYRTMSPHYYSHTYANGSNGNAYILYVAGNGQLPGNGSDASIISGMRPVVNLKADTLFTGSGTSSDPYTVVS